MSNTKSVTLFQNETGVAVSSKFNALMKGGVGMDLGEGIRSSYAIVSIKGGRWRVKYKGNETMLMDYSNPQYPAPVPFIDVVIVKANPFLNKQFYKGQFVEGSTAAPDCYSLDGKIPSPQVVAPVHSNCALCPMNQFGSRVSDDGKKTKACRDTKKLAVVPLVDLRNQAMGGAMLFRVPPSALKDLSTMADALKGRGYPYNGIAVRIGFDMAVSHPKPTFQALRPLSDEEADVVIEMFSSDSVAAVLADNEDITLPPEDTGPTSAQFLQPTPVANPATQATRPTAQPAPQQPPMQTAPRQAPPVQAHPTQAVVGQVAIQPFNPLAPPPVPSAQEFQHPTYTQPAALQLAPEDEYEDEQPAVAANPFAAPATQQAPRVQQPAPQPAPAANPFAAPASAAPASAAPASAAPAQQAPPAAPRKRRAPVTPVASPATAAPAGGVQGELLPPSAEIPVSGSQLDEDIGNILSGLGGFGGGN